jgi:hypothetical protein
LFGEAVVAQASNSRNKKRETDGGVKRPNPFGYNRILLFYKILETAKSHVFSLLIENSV